MNLETFLVMSCDLCINRHWFKFNHMAFISVRHQVIYLPDVAKATAARSNKLTLPDTGEQTVMHRTVSLVVCLVYLYIECIRSSAGTRCRKHRGTLLVSGDGPCFTSVHPHPSGVWTQIMHIVGFSVLFCSIVLSHLSRIMLS